MARPFAGKIFNCKQCNQSFKRSQSQIARGRTSFCSLRCSGMAHRGERNPSFKHGQAARGQISPTYNCWRGMIDRCTVKSSMTYKSYGAKGITVCDRWSGVDGFNNFLADMGERPTLGHSIDRIDGTKNYEPDNCRWADVYQQTNNQKSNRKVIWEGKEYNISQLMRKLSIFTESGVYYSRLDRGWSVERTFLTPVASQIR